MIVCPTCSGEGKVRTAPEKGLQWLGYAGTGLLLLGIAPTTTTLFYGFARFITLLTDTPMQKKGFGGEIEMSFHASSLVFIGGMLGIIITGLMISVLADEKPKR